jgi:hypothetical protein
MKYATGSARDEQARDEAGEVLVKKAAHSNEIPRAG